MQTLQKIASLILEYPECFAQDQEQEDYEYTIPVKIEKSENKDARWCYLAQLQQIPGVSDQVAMEIAKVYPNLFSLLNAFTKSQNPASMLENMILPDRKLTKTGKPRTIGPVLAENIWLNLGSPKS